jgi:hypothetical protein
MNKESKKTGTKLIPILLSCFPAFLLSCFPAFLLSCFPAFLLSCFPAFLIRPSKDYLSTVTFVFTEFAMKHSVCAK